VAITTVPPRVVNGRSDGQWRVVVSIVDLEDESTSATADSIAEGLERVQFEKVEQRGFLQLLSDSASTESAALDKAIADRNAVIRDLLISSGGDLTPEIAEKILQLFGNPICPPNAYLCCELVEVMIAIPGGFPASLTLCSWW
jgi:hypothetical protein